MGSRSDGQLNGPQSEGARWLPDLPPGQGQDAHPAKHHTCPGHAAAVIESDDGYEAAYLCLDPVGHGHVTLEEGDGPSPGQPGAGRSGAGDDGSGWSEEQKAERRVVVANNKAWDAAEEVRLAFVAELLRRRTTPKGTLRFVTELLLSDSAVATSGTDRDLRHGAIRPRLRSIRSVQRAGTMQLSERAVSRVRSGMK